MICHMPFLVGAGQLPDNEFRAASGTLAREWGGSFMEFCCDASSELILKSLPNENGLVALNGDPAITKPYGGSWLEALGAWRRPTVLLALSSLSGKMPGTAAAYVALCKSFSVPLLGTIQVGGDWEPSLRRLDGLPWCGWLPACNSLDEEWDSPLSRIDNLYAEKVVFEIRRRLLYM